MSGVRDNLDKQVVGPVVELAAEVKAKLEELSGGGLVKTDWGNFYVARVELRYFDGGDSEIVGYLVPDEGDGSTFDFYTPRDSRAES